MKTKTKRKKRKYTGDLCGVCGEKQFITNSGVTCKHGHGGAPPLLEGDDLEGFTPDELDDDDLKFSAKEPEDSWEALNRFPTEAETKKALRSIPDDMAEALQIEPALLLTAHARIHGLMAHWSTRMAYAKGRLNTAKAAKSIGLKSLMADRRRALNRLYDRVTEGMVEERAMATDEYARLCLVEAKAETEYLRVKGLVDTLVMKSNALRSLSYSMRPEMGMADNDYQSPGDLNQIGHPDPEVNSSLASVREKMFGVSKQLSENVTPGYRKGTKRKK